MWFVKAGTTRDNNIQETFRYATFRKNRNFIRMQKIISGPFYKNTMIRYLITLITGTIVPVFVLFTLLVLQYPWLVIIVEYKCYIRNFLSYLFID